MPELPDITVYLDAIATRMIGHRVERIRVFNPFVLRSVEPPLDAASGRPVVAVRRVGKRIVIELEDALFVVIHLMIAGRLRWLAPDAKIPKRLGLAAIDIATGSLLLTEAGTTRRASVTLVEGEAALHAIDRGGLNVFDATPDDFIARLRLENHTLKRTLTDPRLFDGIGNAYSDEILHRAKLSPVSLSQRLPDDDAVRLYHATREVLQEWIGRLRTETGDGFPAHVTAFRPEMAVHGKYGQPCPVCGTPVQRIRYATNETNYCARCQTHGKLLADRALSRLLKQDWPKSIDELASSA